MRADWYVRTTRSNEKMKKKYGYVQLVDLEKRREQILYMTTSFNQNPMQEKYDIRVLGMKCID